MLIQAMVRSNCVRCNDRVVVRRYIQDVRTLDSKTNKVFTIASILRRTKRLQSTIAIPLIKGLITSTPRRSAKVITRLIGRICRIFFHPFIGCLVVAILRFNYFPFIRQFKRGRRARFITHASRFKDQRVIKDTSDIAARVFRSTCLTTSPYFINGTTRQTRIIVVTRPFGYNAFAIRVRSLIQSSFSEASAREHNVFIFRHVTFVRFKRYEVRHQEVKQPRYEIICRRVLIRCFFIMFHALLFIKDCRFTIKDFRFNRSTVINRHLTQESIRAYFRISSNRVLLCSEHNRLHPPYQSVNIFIGRRVGITMRTYTQVPT